MYIHILFATRKSAPMPLEVLASQQTVPLIVQLLLLAYLLTYFVLAARRVYSSGWLAVVLKSAAVLFVYGILLSLAIENTSNFLIIAD